MKLKVESEFLAFCCNGCILTEGGTNKNHPEQNLPDKNPRTKPPVKNLRELRHMYAYY